MQKSRIKRCGFFLGRCQRPKKKKRGRIPPTRFFLKFLSAASVLRKLQQYAAVSGRFAPGFAVAQTDQFKAVALPAPERPRYRNR